MNCKQGDLAIKVAGHGIGTIVRCVRYVGEPDVGARTPDRDCWLLDRPMTWYWGGTSEPAGNYPYASDSKLRPIRDNDNEDEIVSIVKAKRVVTAPTSSGDSARIGKRVSA